MDSCLSDPVKIIPSLRSNWGHASANQSKRVSADPDRGAMGLGNYVDEASGRCAICRAFEKVPQIPIAGTATASDRPERVQVDLLSLDGATALSEIDISSKRSPLIPASPQGV